MVETIARLLGASTGLLVVVLFMSAVVLAFLWPLMLFSMMRNMGRIRAQLERLNDNIERRRESSPGNVIGL